MEQVGGRIAILHYAAPPVVGGVEATIYHHARLLAAKGYPVDIIAGRGKPFHPLVRVHLVPEADSQHPDVLAVGKELAKGKCSADFLALRDRLVVQLRTLLTGAAACIVHNVLTLHKNLPLTATLRILSDERITRFIAWCHDFAWRDARYLPALHDGYPWDLLRTEWPGVHYVVVSYDQRANLAELLNIPAESITVIPPGIEPSELLKLDGESIALIERLDLLAADPLLLLPARITRRKNIEFALYVMAALCRAMPAATLLVTGPPGAHNPSNVAYLESLQRLRVQLGLMERAHFLYQCGPGDQPWHVSDRVMADLYQLADILLFPSEREGFGIPVLEAALARMPIFASDIPSVRESAGEWAWLFDPHGDADQVARAIAGYCATDRAYQLRRRVLRHYTWRHVLEQHLIPLLSEVLEGS
ncbi:MAG: glycosyltransferase family 4 protein [Anaerolineae bacterium]